jgi:hypothetical protein
VATRLDYEDIASTLFAGASSYATVPNRPPLGRLWHDLGGQLKFGSVFFNLASKI